MCTPEKLSKLYLDTVTSVNGVESAAVNDDGAVVVQSRERVTFVIHNHAPADPEFLHITCTVRTDDDPVRVAEACAKVNLRVKGATLMQYRENTIVCSVEMVIAGASCMPSREVVVGLLPRAFNMTTHAISEFLTENALNGILAATETA